MALFSSCSECTHYINSMVAPVIDMYMYMYLGGADISIMVSQFGQGKSLEPPALPHCKVAL